jgi:site-specific recombinase XerD
MVDHGATPQTLNVTISGLKFFFGITLKRPEVATKLQPVKYPRKLPTVLSREEAKRLIAASPNIKHQVALSVAYGAGLRVSEVVGLRVTDIDSERMLLRVVEGKGGKDRFVMLSPLLLQRLRTWWRVGRRQGKMLDGGWLFPGMNPVEPLCSRQLNRAVRAAAAAAGISKRVGMHTPRHSSGNRIIPAADERRAYFPEDLAIWDALMTAYSEGFREGQQRCGGTREPPHNGQCLSEVG